MTVVDLDGTFVRGNTLHIFLCTAIAHHLRRGRPATAAAIAMQYVKRALRLSDHLQFKTRSLRLAGTDPELLGRFTAKAKKKINGRLRESLAVEAQPVVMATAAPEFYARLLWNGPLIASRRLPDGSLDELRGDRKLQAVLDFARQYGCGDISKVYTDHYDDLPLMQAARKTVLVAPSAETLRRVKDAKVAFHTF